MAERTINPAPKPAPQKGRRGKSNVGLGAEPRVTSKEEQFEELLGQGVDEHEARAMVWGDGPTTSTSDDEQPAPFTDEEWATAMRTDLVDAPDDAPTEDEPSADNWPLPPPPPRAPRLSRAEQRLQEIRQRGLARGPHTSPEDGYCVLEAYSVYAGQRFTAEPKGVAPVLRWVAMRANDSLGDTDRQLLIPLIPRLAGTASAQLDEPRTLLLADRLFLLTLPRALGEERFLQLCGDDGGIATTADVAPLRAKLEQEAQATSNHDTRGYLDSFAYALKFIEQGLADDDLNGTSILGACVAQAIEEGWLTGTQVVSLIGDLIACPVPQGQLVGV